MENKLSKKSNNNDSGHDLRDVVLAYIGEKSVSPKIQSENEIKPAIANPSMKAKTAMDINTVRIDSSKEKKDHEKMVSHKPSLREKQAVLAKIDAPNPQNDIKKDAKLKSESRKQKKASPKSKSSPREKKIKKISPKLSPLIDKKKEIDHKKISGKKIITSNPPLFPLIFKTLWILNILVIIFLMVLLICVLLYYI